MLPVAIGGLLLCCLCVMNLALLQMTDGLTEHWLCSCIISSHHAADTAVADMAHGVCPACSLPARVSRAVCPRVWHQRRHL
jgi:hypothetical protein